MSDDGDEVEGNKDTLCVPLHPYIGDWAKACAPASCGGARSRYWRSIASVHCAFAKRICARASDKEVIGRI